MTEDKLQTDQTLKQGQSLSIAHVCQTLGVSRITLYRYLAPS